jgi:MFS family permease
LSTYFRREIFSSIFVQLFSVFSLSIFGAYYVIVLDDLKATAIIIGVVLTIRNFVQIFLRVPFSELSQIIGRKPLIITGNLCYTLSLGLMFIASHWGIVLIASLLTGIGMSMHWPAFFSYVGDISDGDYGRIQGFIFMGQDLGVLMGTFLAAYVLDNDIVTVKGLFGLAFIISTLALMFSTLILPEVLEDAHRKKVESRISALKTSFVNMTKSVVELTKDYSLRIIFLFELLFIFTEFFVTSFFPLLIVVSLGYEDSVVAEVLLGSTLILILFKPIFGKVFDHFGFRGPVISAMIITSSMIFMLPLTNTFWELLTVYTILSAAIMIGYISSTGGTSNATVPAQRGLAMGVLGVYISSGRTASSAFLSPMLGIFENQTGSRSEGLDVLFAFTAILTFILTIIMALYSRNLDKKSKLIKSPEVTIDTVIT